MTARRLKTQKCS